MSPSPLDFEPMAELNLEAAENSILICAESVEDCRSAPRDAAANIGIYLRSPIVELQLVAPSFEVGVQLALARYRQIAALRFARSS